ncbi:hypothetical protein CAPTEDRAFT_191029 [Capitella teleta]|uniref:RRM domain-containing protein n=1 Tax=Capitella teleta TaxID=283909 RepID=R7V5M5_CAPTE|nr:hypothetical protein CAPTEDRAFT_191029 [Capitella teleta]|eukprot:ELU11085.1 hypothetical protein CAPTEDRAFT_191029 [Capitella teleta]
MAIKLCNVPCSMTAEMLEELLENWHGRPLSPGTYISIDEETREAIVTFGDAAEADTMARCQTIDFKDVTMMVEKLSPPTARDLAEYYSIADYAADEMDECGSYPETGGKLVLISGFDYDCDEYTLQSLLENNNPSGGSPIQDWNIDREVDAVLIRCEHQEDTDDVLTRERVTSQGNTYETSKPNVDVFMEDTMAIKLCNVPCSMTAEMLEELLENRHGRPLLPGTYISIDEETREAIVTFGDAAEADTMAGCQTIDFKDVTMIVEKLSPPTARDLAEYYSIADYAADEMDECGSYPETGGKLVLISGFDYDCDEYTLQSLLENNNPSGGSPIQDWNIDREVDAVLIRCEHQEEAETETQSRHRADTVHSTTATTLQDYTNRPRDPPAIRHRYN